MGRNSLNITDEERIIRRKEYNARYYDKKGKENYKETYTAPARKIKPLCIIQLPKSLHITCDIDDERYLQINDFIKSIQT